MSLNVPIFEAIAPEFAGLTSTTQRDTLAGLAQNQVSSDIWGKHYDHAVALLTAHMMKIASKNGSSGAVQTEKVGDVSVSYNTAALAFVTKGDELQATSYGQEFKRLRKQILRTPVIVA